MSLVCCVSSNTTPGAIACTVPASTNSMSPTETGTHSNNFSIVPLVTAAFTAATPAPGFNPNATAAPGSASSTYQHSVFPRVSPNLCAHASSGCTCTESFSAGNNNFTN